MEKAAGISSRDIIGYTIISLGIAIILISLFNGYSLFTGSTKPRQLFALPGISVDLTKSMTSQLTEMQRAALPPSQPEQLIPAQSVNEPLNLFANIFILGFFVTVGAKIAGVGVDMTRPYIVKAPTKTPLV